MAPGMVLSNANVFKFTLIPQWTYFLLVRKIRPFLDEKLVIPQSEACCWFYALTYAKWLPLNMRLFGKKLTENSMHFQE